MHLYRTICVYTQLQAEKRIRGCPRKTAQKTPHLSEHSQARRNVGGGPLSGVADYQRIGTGMSAIPLE